MKLTLFLSLFSLFLLTACQPINKFNLKGGETKMVDLTGKKVLMVVAPQNFRDEELFQPKAVLEKAGCQVDVASKNTAEATGMLEGKIKIDVDVAQVKPADYNAVVFVGGSGAAVYFQDEAVLNLAREAVGQGKIVAAICIAPSILANAGVLKGKKATAFPSEKNNLAAQGAVYLNQPVVVEGKIITGQGPQAAQEFGQKISQALGFDK